MPLDMQYPLKLNKVISTLHFGIILIAFAGRNEYHSHQMENKV